MLPQPQEGAEPIPGYQLTKRLGTGGYGEVWKAMAPGGVPKAVKIIYGHMNDARAEQELRSLGRIKTVRHPFLLSLERFDVVDGRLFIVTELADLSLMDRFQQCRDAGLRGIPRDELLGYLRDAAEALDYIRESHGLQHLDVKPQNLLLVSGRIKVADFGLVKDLRGTSATVTGGLTPVYAPPEAFDARVSRHSDQYSLAIVYQEMLTGERPFPGTTALQLAAQHTTSPPMLDALPGPDRPAIARSLAKVPDQRYPSCRELLDNLLRPQAAPTALPAPTPAGQPLPAVPMPPTSVREELLARATEVGVKPTPSPSPAPTVTTRRVPAAGPKTLPPVEASVRPTLFVGIGGLACSALRRLRRRLYLRFGDLSAVPVLRLLLLDTDRATLQRAHQGEAGEGLAADETLLTPLHSPEHYRDRARELLRWIERRWLYGIPRSLQTEGLRPLGRLALVDNAAEVLARLREAVAQVASPEARTTAQRTLGTSLRSPEPRVFVVAGIGGGSGGGMLLDTAYAVRQVLAEAGLPGAAVTAMLAHATGPKPAGRDLARINAQATLAELAHFSAPGAGYPGDPDRGLAPAGPGVPPFRVCYLVPLGEGLDEAGADAATNLVAEYLYLDAVTPSGAFLDQGRQLAGSGVAGTVWRTFGVSRLGFPRHRLVDLTAVRFCRRLVDGWRGEADDAGDKGREQGRAAPPFAAALEAEALQAHFQSAARALLPEAPEALFQKLLAEAPQPPPAGAAPRSPAELGGLLLARLDVVLGPGRDDDAASTTTLTPFETALRQQAVEFGAEQGRRAAEWLRSLVEEPARRLKAADRAARWFGQHLRAATEMARGLLAHERSQRRLFRRQLLGGEAGKKASGARWLGIGGAQGGGAEPPFVKYAWARLAEAALESALEVYAAVSRALVAFGEGLAECRLTLSRLAEAFRAPPARTGADHGAVPNVTEFLPGASQSLDEAVETVFTGLGPEVLRQFDETLQAEVLEPLGGLWGLAVEKKDLARALPDELLVRARAAMQEATADLNAARLFLEAHPDPAEARRALLEKVEAAAPRLAAPGGWQHLLAAVPPGPAGDALRELIPPSLAGVPVTVVDSDGDVVLCPEAALLPLPQAAMALTGDEPVYAAGARRVLTRTDVDWSAGGEDGA